MKAPEQASAVQQEPAYREWLRGFLRENALPLHKYGHQPRLYALTQVLGRDLNYDDDVVFAAVWLHDLGVFVGHRPEEAEALRQWDHVAYAKAEVPGILKQAGFPESKIGAVLAVIEEHQPKDEPRSTESVLVRDADILEQLGAMGTLRTAAKIGSDTRFHTFTDALANMQRALDLLPGLLRLPSARALAEPKIRTMRAFLAAAREEGRPDAF